MCDIQGNSEFVEWLINSQFYTDEQNEAHGFNFIDNEGKSPLHWAAEKGIVLIEERIK